jgi:hypothetical protein
VSLIPLCITVCHCGLMRRPHNVVLVLNTYTVRRSRCICLHLFAHIMYQCFPCFLFVCLALCLSPPFCLPHLSVCLYRRRRLSLSVACLCFPHMSTAMLFSTHEAYCIHLIRRSTRSCTLPPTYISPVLAKYDASNDNDANVLSYEHLGHFVIQKLQGA